MNNKNDENYIYYLVSKNLKRLRKSKNLTQTQFAEKCNYSPGFIMNIESKSFYQTFSLGTLWTFAKVLNVDVREFFKPLDEESKKD